MTEGGWQDPRMGMHLHSVTWTGEGPGIGLEENKNMCAGGKEGVIAVSPASPWWPPRRRDISVLSVVSSGQLGARMFTARQHKLYCLNYLQSTCPIRCRQLRFYLNDSDQECGFLYMRISTASTTAIPKHLLDERARTRPQSKEGHDVGRGGEAAAGIENWLRQFLRPSESGLVASVARRPASRIGGVKWAIDERRHGIPCLFGSRESDARRSGRLGLMETSALWCREFIGETRSAQ
ncbi:hypothetical protein EI94DRAFT_1785399 [Lactarius quietus]|nr:hypothetical protein EI94DRAFT_1785399 [Lactarius quietus]